MKLRALAVALASASIALPGGAHAADDFCSRLIVQAINQFCQSLPNGLNLCQPIALVGPGPECATPERQGLVSVPLGPPTLQPPTPWAAPYAGGAYPATQASSSATSSATSSAANLPPATPVNPFAPTRPNLPRIMAEVPKPVAATVPVAPTAAVVTPPPPAVAAVVVPVAAASAPTVVPTVVPTIAATARPAAAIPEPMPVIAAVVTPAPNGTSATATPTPPPVVTLVVTPAVTAAATIPEAAPRSEPVAAASVAAAPSVTTPPVSAPQATADAAQPAAPAEDGADALAHFDFDSAALTTAGRAVLDAWLAEAPKNKSLRVSGYADRLGPEPYNLKLSLRRAEAVKQYLTGKGINPRRIQLEAKGEAEPVKRCKGGATPATKVCLAPNRRVKIDPE